MAEMVSGEPVGKTPTETDVMAGLAQGLNGADQEDISLQERIRIFFADNVPWRSRVISLALIVGLLCGVVACLYEMVMDFVLEYVWEYGYEKYTEHVIDALLPSLPPWTYILVVCILFGTLTGCLIRLLGEPMANLPGVVLAAHRDGSLGYSEAPAMGIISIASITAGGSLGPEAPLVSIGGGLASFVSMWVDLTEAETLFVTMCGMGAGLAAFFGEPVGGALFACEVLHRYGLEYYEAVVPTVVAGLSCNWSFRVLANLPQKPIWTFDFEEPLLPWTSILGLGYGLVGGVLGWAWMRGTNLIREKVMVPCKLGPRHILKGFLGGCIIGGLGVLYPETLFWAEYESQTIISHGNTALPHVNPKVGALGEYSLSDPFALTMIGLLKLVAISFTVLAGYRGGFIFPFMFAGNAIGSAMFFLIRAQFGWEISQAAAALSVACAINVAVTRTVLATPIVLSALSGRIDTFPTLLVASLVSIFVTGDESIIKAARKRWLRAELDGAHLLTDRTPVMADRKRIESKTYSRGNTPGNSSHGGNVFLHLG